MKQKAAIEKHYAEGLLKLSSVYGTKKIAAVGGEATQFQNQEISKTKLRIVTMHRIEGQLTFKSFAIYPLLIPLLDSKHLTHDKSKDLSRVAKCHGYDGYIRLKILVSWGKSLGEHIIWQNQAFLGEDLYNV